jgi:hypothetical protein
MDPSPPDSDNPLLPPSVFSDESMIDAEAARLYERIRSLLASSRSRAARSVNSEMVRAYWSVGQAIVEQEQKGRGRADYGERLIESLAKSLTEEFGRGFTATNLRYFRQFYLTFPIHHALRDELSWTHYRLLLKVDDPDSRLFYEREAAQQSWSTRELERQIGSLFYERTVLSADRRTRLAESRAHAERYSPEEFAREPSIIEFLGLPLAEEIESEILGDSGQARGN